MDDVIERICRQIDVTMDEEGYEWQDYESAVLAALRVVRDTHRLVPVEPDGNMRQAANHASFSGMADRIRYAIQAAPDYTEGSNG